LNFESFEDRDLVVLEMSSAMCMKGSHEKNDCIRRSNNACQYELVLVQHLRDLQRNMMSEVLCCIRDPPAQK